MHVFCRTLYLALNHTTSVPHYAQQIRNCKCFGYLWLGWAKLSYTGKWATVITGVPTTYNHMPSRCAVLGDLHFYKLSRFQTHTYYFIIINLPKISIYVKDTFEVLTTVIIRNMILCDMTPCGPVDGFQHFGETWCLYLPSMKVKNSPTLKMEAGSLSIHLYINYRISHLRREWLYTKSSSALPFTSMSLIAHVPLYRIMGQITQLNLIKTQNIY